ncbi:MAG: hypothetical protein J0H98_11345 [Solirubrobacterales bacterium]|nr:hypothetical protein [Solirubrobacterales bacterium]
MTVAALLGLGASASAAPIVSAPPLPSLPAHSGKPFKATPVRSATRAPRNPFMAPDPKGNIHNDTWMSDTYPWPGPLGMDPITSSASAPPGICATIAFDSRGRIISVCPSIVAPPQARIIDPDTLEVLASHDMPNAPPVDGTPNFQNFAAGGYFYLDGRDRIWVATKTNHLQVLQVTANPDGFQLERDFDLTRYVDPETERINSALPDFRGRVWFVTKQNGKVGVLNRKTGAVHVLRLGEQIQNSFTVGREGVYVATDRRLYRLGVGPKGRPFVVWKAKYGNTAVAKPGQVDAGTGTTPTILAGGLIAITDNSDPMRVVVYRTAKKLRRGQQRTVCRMPVFSRGAGATENSLIGTGRSLIVENNYGYTDPFAVGGGQVVSQAGFARVDIRPKNRGCRKVWVNRELRAPSVVPKPSTRTGLIYTYTRPPDPSGSQGYYWAAIDFRTGRTAWTVYAGSGLRFNNNYAGLGLGPDGTAYLGVIGGMVSLQDAK